MKEKMKLKGKKVAIRWYDSYGVTAGWRDISDYAANTLVVESYGVVIYEDKKVISLAHNYARETALTFEQANGIMVIPKCCIKKIRIISSFSFYREPVSKQTRQHS